MRKATFTSLCLKAVTSTTRLLLIPAEVQTGRFHDEGIALCCKQTVTTFTGIDTEDYYTCIQHDAHYYIQRLASPKYYKG